MKKYFTLLILLHAAIISSYAQGQFVKSYQIGAFGKVAVETFDSNMVILGGQYEVQIYGDVFIIKVNPSGDTLWSRAYGGTFADLRVPAYPALAES